MFNHNKKIIVISGPTASGKTFLGIKIAKLVNGVIINADSMQIYQGLPVLSAQPSLEENQEVEHRLYNIFLPNENNNVFKWLELVKENCYDIIKQNKIPIILGGTGMYISRFIKGIKELPDIPLELRNEAIKLYDEMGYEKFCLLVKKIDPQYFSQINLNDKQRLMRIYEIYTLTGNNLTFYQNIENETLFNRKDIFHINLMPDRDILYKRCELRFKLMCEENKIINEVLNFIKIFLYVFDESQKYSVLNTIGFREIYSFIQNKISFDEMFSQTVKITRNYAKRQFTWFRNQFIDTEFTLSDIPEKKNIENILNKILKLL